MSIFLKKRSKLACLVDKKKYFFYSPCRAGEWIKQKWKKTTKTQHLAGFSHFQTTSTKPEPCWGVSHFPVRAKMPVEGQRGMWNLGPPGSKKFALLCKAVMGWCNKTVKLK